MTRINDALNRYRELNFEWADQDVLNYVVREDQIELDPALNCFGQRQISRPLIHHFAGSSKPWVPEAVFEPELLKGYVHWHRTAKELLEALSVVDCAQSEAVRSVARKLESIEEKPLSRLRLMSFARRAENLVRKILGR
jgi:lipopolysaccharide biosynthesis glycosyltransferase